MTIAFDHCADFEALQSKWETLTRQEAALGTPESDEGQAQLQDLLEQADAVEAVLIKLPPLEPEAARTKLRIIERALRSGADAAHVVWLFDQCRADLMQSFRGVSARD